MTSNPAVCNVVGCLLILVSSVSAGAQAVPGQSGDCEGIRDAWLIASENYLKSPSFVSWRAQPACQRDQELFEKYIKGLCLTPEHREESACRLEYHRHVVAELNCHYGPERRWDNIYSSEIAVMQYWENLAIEKRCLLPNRGSANQGSRFEDEYEAHYHAFPSLDGARIRSFSTGTPGCAGVWHKTWDMADSYFNSPDALEWMSSDDFKRLQGVLESVVARRCHRDVAASSDCPLLLSDLNIALRRAVADSPLSRKAKATPVFQDALKAFNEAVDQGCEPAQLY